MSRMPISVLDLVPKPDVANRFLLHPGDVALGTRGDTFETLLGSCVAVVLTDPRRTVGAMCHIVHTGEGLSGTPRDSSFGDTALERMYSMLRVRGIEPRLCEAYVYGGGNMFPNLFAEGHVGTNNATWTLEALMQDGLQVLHQDLGGNQYRKLSWVVGTGAPRGKAVAV
jgi:chemotaxis protein CheD